MRNLKQKWKQFSTFSQSGWQQFVYITYIMQYNGSWMHDFDIFEHYIQCRRMNRVPKIVFIFYFKQTMGLQNTCIYCSCAYRITNWLLLVLSLRFIKIFYFTRLKPLSIRWWQNSHWLSAWLPAMACGPLNKRFWCHCLLLTFLCDIYCNKMINSDKVWLARLAHLNEREREWKGRGKKAWRHFYRKSKRKTKRVLWILLPWFNQWQ